MLSNRAIDDLVEVVDRAEQERKREHIDDWRRIAKRAHIDAVDVDGADARLLDGLAFLNWSM
jgi:hypothetical protein